MKMKKNVPIIMEIGPKRKQEAKPSKIPIEQKDRMILRRNINLKSLLREQKQARLKREKRKGK